MCQIDGQMLRKGKFPVIYFEDGLMQKLIEFIEKVGSEASYSCLSKSQYEAEVVGLGLRSEEARALLERDVHALVSLTGGKKVMVCMIALPEDDAGETDDAVEVTELSASRIH